MGISPYEIPPALRATSLFKGGFGRTMFAPTVEMVCLLEQEWDLQFAYRETEIPRRGEQAAVAAVRLPFFLRWIGG